MELWASPEARIDTTIASKSLRVSASNGFWMSRWLEILRRWWWYVASVISDNPCAVWDTTKSSNTSSIGLWNCPFNVIFRAIFRPHAFHRNLLLGMRSKFFVEKEKTVETLRVSTVWWRLGDSNILRSCRRPAGGKRQSTGLSQLDGFESHI